MTTKAGIVVGLIALGCGGDAPKPQLHLTVHDKKLVISGSGFSHKLECVQLSLIGLPAPALVELGMPECSDGAFDDFAWRFDRVGCANPSKQRDIVVLGVGDLNKVPVASASGKIAWDDKCGLAEYCGAIGQPPCPTGCLEGAEAFGTCQHCGKEGQVICDNNKCDGDLRPDFQNGITICTDLCGHAQGSPCVDTTPNCAGHPPVLTLPQRACKTVKTKSGGGTFDVFACYDGSRLPNQGGQCLCQPDGTGAGGSCGTDSSPTNGNDPAAGTCTHDEFKDCP